MPVTSPRASAVGKSHFIPLHHDNSVEHRRILAEALDAVANGKILPVGDVTLTANQTTTTLSDPRIGPRSKVFLIPESANAALAVNTAGGVYISAYADGSCTITHANNAQTDRDFGYVILGA